MSDTTDDTTWDHIGDVCVDSGQLRIGDPCYDADDTDLTLTFTTAYGDGVYPVVCQRTPDGRILTVVIDLDPMSIYDQPPTVAQQDAYADAMIAQDSAS